MKLLYVLDTFPSKSEYFILNEITELRRRGFVITILAYRKDTVIASAQQDLGVIYNSMLNQVKGHFFLVRYHFQKYSYALQQAYLRNKSRLYLLLKGLRDLSIAVGFYYRVHRGTYQHIHAHFAFLATDIAFPLSYLMSLSFSFTTHANDLYTIRIEDLKQKMSKARFIVTCTKYNQTYLRKICQNVKIEHIYHGLDSSLWPFKSRSKIPSARPMKILFVGRLVEKKGVKYLIQAIQILIQENLSVECMIVGEGPQHKEIVSMVNSCDLVGSVRMIGWVKQSRLKQLYQRCDMLILPSVISRNGDRDGLPNVLLESLSCGLPVITTNVSAIPELVIPGVTGIVICPRDPIAIVKAIKLLMKNGLAYSSLSKNGRQKVENDFSIEASTDKLQKMFSKI